jgi:alanine dehydrogenase
VFVDIAIDQGGCAVTSRPTTHADPVYVEHGVVHYCVANMPGAYPRTSTMALTNSTLPYAVAIANAEKNWKKLLAKKPILASGFNTFQGKLTCSAVAETFGLPYTDLADLV